MGGVDIERGPAAAPVETVLRDSDVSDSRAEPPAGSVGNDKEGQKTVQIVAGVSAAAVVLMLVCVAVLFFLYRRRRGRSAHTHGASNSMHARRGKFRVGSGSLDNAKEGAVNRSTRGMHMHMHSMQHACAAPSSGNMSTSVKARSQKMGLVPLSGAGTLEATVATSSMVSTTVASVLSDVAPPGEGVPR